MSKQKITLGSNGVVQFKRTQPVNTRTNTRVTSAIKLTRLHQLLRTQKPKICIVRGEGIGDVLMATPTVHAIKNMFGQVEITFATNTRYLGGALVGVLSHNPDISNIIERDLIDDLTFDLTINLQCPAIAHEKKGKIPANRIDLFANHAGVKLVDPKPRYFIQKDEIELAEVMLSTVNPQEKLIMVQPSASSKSRSGIQSKVKQALVKLYNEHRVRSLILTHSTDQLSDIMWDNIPGSLIMKNVDLRGIAGLMVHCDLVLCPDSSILHLAGALDVPCVGLFGPTPPQSRINHYKRATAIWEGKDIVACPCWYEHCVTGYSCWERVACDQIVTECLRRLENDVKVNILELMNNIKTAQIETEIV